MSAARKQGDCGGTPRKDGSGRQGKPGRGRGGNPGGNKGTPNQPPARKPNK